MRRLPPVILLLSLSFAAAGCSRPAGLFSEQNARAHVETLAATIGSRPAGSPANARARAYIVDQLRLFGYEVRVQETDARRPELGRTARVANIIATLPGSRPQAVGLLSHYDSRPGSPGGGDDAFGVAVSLEAARVLASTASRRWTTFVLVTDAEEDGLMGAAALMTDQRVRDDLSTYINLESIGSGSPVILFETGPMNAWLLKSWSRSAPNPRGGSYVLEIYKRLPNDTDFSVLRRHQIPGLNFASVGDSYAYHTSRDTADRLSAQALRDAGENVVAIASALQQSDITLRTSDEATYFDVGGTAGVSYGVVGWWVTTMLSLTLGVLAWFRVTRFLVRAEGAGPWLLGLVWVVAGAAASVAAMMAATWALRATREAYHPWYAAPDRLFLLLAATGAAAAWMMARAGRWIPARARGLRHPAIAWTYALPLWLLLAGAVSWAAPSAAYLWTLPVLTAGAVLLVLPVGSVAAVRIASLLVLAVVATLWLRNSVDLLRFAVATLGREPLITPVFVYAALLALPGIMVVPPLFSATASMRPLLRPSIATALLLACVAAFGISAWLAPAYTPERPLRRVVRALQEPGAQTSVWQVASLEPGLDLANGAPDGWTRTPPMTTVPWGTLRHPFVFSASAPPLPAPPVTLPAVTIAPTAEGAGHTMSVTVMPKEPSLTATIVLPPGLTPARSNLPGVVRSGRWMATYVAIPPEGLSWQASFSTAGPDLLKGVRVALTSARVPGGAGPDALPAWLPQDRTAWTSSATWVLDPLAPPALEPVPPLR